MGVTQERDGDGDHRGAVSSIHGAGVQPSPRRENCGAFSFPSPRSSRAHMQNS